MGIEIEALRGTVVARFLRIMMVDDVSMGKVMARMLHHLGRVTSHVVRSISSRGLL
jgi:hypothetical protein